MIPGTFQALAVVVTAILPGAAFIWSFERATLWPWGSASVGDRVLHFVTAAGVFHILAAWPEYLLWREQYADRQEITPGRFAILWFFILASGAGPALFGLLIGRAWLRRGFSRRTARGWDAWQFSALPKDNYIRVRIKDSSAGHQWVGGYFGPRSIAATPPHSGDIFLEWAYEINEDGSFGARKNHGVYVPADRIEWLEVIYDGASGTG